MWDGWYTNFTNGYVEPHNTGESWPTPALEYIDVAVKESKMKSTRGFCLDGWNLKTTRLSFWKVYHRSMEVGNYMGWCISSVKRCISFLLEEFASVGRCLLNYFLWLFFNYFLLIYQYGFTMPAVPNTGQYKNFIWGTGSRSIALCWRTLCW